MNGDFMIRSITEHDILSTLRFIFLEDIYRLAPVLPRKSRDQINPNYAHLS